tara:strand:- start:130 stop:270 length:141 start_codon:yes stop_codon:yes gene_type:complete
MKKINRYGGDDKFLGFSYPVLFYLSKPPLFYKKNKKTLILKKNKDF